MGLSMLQRAGAIRAYLSFKFTLAFAWLCSLKPLFEQLFEGAKSRSDSQIGRVYDCHTICSRRSCVGGTRARVGAIWWAPFCLLAPDADLSAQITSSLEIITA